MAYDQGKHMEIFIKMTRFEFINEGLFKCPLGSKNSSSNITVVHPETVSLKKCFCTVHCLFNFIEFLSWTYLEYNRIPIMQDELQCNNSSKRLSTIKSIESCFVI